MRPRTSVIEIFSTFIQFVDNRFETWISDPRLLRSMQKHCPQKPTASSEGSQNKTLTQNETFNGANARPEGLWVLMWYQKWQKKEYSLALMHLNAYLQEACYWAAENVTKRFVSLLILSACETATGDSRAALGLAGIALQSGTRSTLASLWNLDDASGAIFISQFYEALARPNTTKAEALQQAQLSLLQNPSYRHPTYWSAYVLVGNWL